MTTPQDRSGRHRAPIVMTPAAARLIKAFGVTPRPGIREIRRTSSGAVVGLYDSRASGTNCVVPLAARWVLVCENHGCCVAWPTRKEALSYMPLSHEWCNVCRSSRRGA